jgi:excinuclease UvrABC ATPase subunit
MKTGITSVRLKIKGEKDEEQRFLFVALHMFSCSATFAACEECAGAGRRRKD